MILMDIQMPNLNGLEATKKIRQLEDAAKAAIPIIAMTANAFDEDRKMALEAGVNGFCTKSGKNVLTKSLFCFIILFVADV